MTWVHVHTCSSYESMSIGKAISAREWEKLSYISPPASLRQLVYICIIYTRWKQYFLFSRVKIIWPWRFIMITACYPSKLSRKPTRKINQNGSLYTISVIPAWELIKLNVPACCKQSWSCGASEWKLTLRLARALRNRGATCSHTDTLISVAEYIANTLAAGTNS